MQRSLDTQLEAILFFRSEPVAIKELATLTNTDNQAVRDALTALREGLAGRGIRVVMTETDAALRTAPEYAELIEQLRREELSRDIGKAGLETLSIVLYKGPVSRAEIDYIRGVNSAFILRNLLVRGLVAKVQNPRDSRATLYEPTIELLGHLGVTRAAELPRYEEMQREFATFATATQHESEISHAADIG